MRPDLCHVENVPSILFRLVGLHGLDVEGSGGKVAFLNRPKEVIAVIIWVVSRKFVRVRLLEVFNTLVRLEMELDVGEASVVID